MLPASTLRTMAVMHRPTVDASTRRNAVKTATLLLSLLVAGFAVAAEPAPQPENHRYVIERHFPAHALDGLDAAKKAKINAVNAQHGVIWMMSYANADRTKTFCIYEGPSETAIREAAKANGIPVDSVTEVPITLEPK